MNTRLLIATAACALALGISAPSFGAQTTTNQNEGASAVTGSAETQLSAQVPEITKDSIDLKKPFGNLTFDMKMGADKVATSMADDKSRMELAARCAMIDSEQLRVEDDSVPAFCKGYVDYYAKNYMK